jgi:hypothetical protein
MPRSRAAALSAVAAAAVADPHLFDSNCGLEDAVKRLCAIRGVGEWTGQYIALRQLREPDAFPAADLGLLRAIAGREGRKHFVVGTPRSRQCVAPVAGLCRTTFVGGSVERRLSGICLGRGAQMPQVLAIN